MDLRSARRTVVSAVVLAAATLAALFTTSEVSAQRPPHIREPRLPGLSAPPPPPVVRQPVASGDTFACMADAGDPTGLAGRDLAGAMRVDYAGMTNQACRTFCGQSGFTYAGTQYGGYCFCGDAFGSHGASNATAPPRSCNLGCAGRPNEVCGGEWANSISLTGAGPAPPADGIQCRVWAQGSYSNPGGDAGEYVASELHRWVKVATLATGPTARKYTFRYSLQVSGNLRAGIATVPWGQTWRVVFQRDEAWTALPGTHPTTGASAWKLYRAATEAVPVAPGQCTAWHGSSSTTTNCGGFGVDAFLQPSAAAGVWSTGGPFVYSKINEPWVARMRMNPLGGSRYTCTWNVSF